MAFILSTDGRDDDVVGQFEKYRDYLHSVEQAFPRGALALAMSDWYFKFDDHRCPHDAWLESAALIELFSGDNERKSCLSLNIRLLGAYHDGHIELHYPRVYSYSFSCIDPRGHRDWRYDEFRLSPGGNLVHEVEWCGFQDAGRWLIEANDIEFRWILNRSFHYPGAIRY